MHAQDSQFDYTAPYAKPWIPIRHFKDKCGSKRKIIKKSRNNEPSYWKYILIHSLSVSTSQNDQHHTNIYTTYKKWAPACTITRILLTTPHPRHPHSNTNTCTHTLTDWTTQVFWLNLEAFKSWSQWLGFLGFLNQSPARLLNCHQHISLVLHLGNDL